MTNEYPKCAAYLFCIDLYKHVYVCIVLVLVCMGWNWYVLQYHIRKNGQVRKHVLICICMYYDLLSCILSVYTCTGLYLIYNALNSL
jgi:hypothetical protein